MGNYNVVLECFEKNDEPVNATSFAEKTDIDKKEVSKVMDKLMEIISSILSEIKKVKFVYILLLFMYN